MLNQSSSEFTAKRILITGAASGFGQSLSRRLAEQGAVLMLSDINDEALQAHAASLRSAYDATIYAQRCDVASEADVKAAITAGVQEAGGLDIAVNNAGMAVGFRSVLEITEEEFDRVYSINTKGVFFGMKHQIPHMLKTGGSILNVSSVAGLLAAPGNADYAAAKHAVSGLTRTVASEFGKKNIRINAICPYFTPTAIIKDMDAKSEAVYKSINPMKRFAEVEEVVTTMMTMIQPSNSYLNGQCLAIDGGITAQ